MAPLRRLGRSSPLGCVVPLWLSGARVHGRLESLHWQIGRWGRLRWQNEVTRRNRHRVIACCSSRTEGGLLAGKLRGRGERTLAGLLQCYGEVRH